VSPDRTTARVVAGFSSPNTDPVRTQQNGKRMAPLAGNLVGHYQIICQVGAGGMGTVFKAFDTTLQRTVALKFLALNPTSSADRDALLREARAASTLDHKNIGTVHAVEESEEGHLFIVMAYYEGQSLASRMTGPPFPVFEAIEIVHQIAEGLGHAHLRNLVHRDVKPSNVILTSSGEAKIVDFGLARFVGPAAATQTQNFSGTLPYMSPEQVMGRPVDARTDIWSLGVITYQLLANRLPFPGDNPASIINGILRASPPELSDSPFELREVVRRALAGRPQDRYQSCGEILQDLDDVAALENRPTVKRGSSEGQLFGLLSSRAMRSIRYTSTRRWVLLLSLFLLAAVLVVSFRHKIFHGKFQGENSASPVAYESYLRGQEYLRRYDKPGNLDEAIKLFESTTQADPKFALAFAALGEAYWNKYLLEQDPKWVQLASATCKRAAELNNQLPTVYVTLGRIHSGTGLRDLAVQEFQRAQELDPHSVPALLGLADTYSTIGRSQEAEDLYKRLSAMHPTDWEGPSRLGGFYYLQHRYSEAVEQFRRVIEIVPDHGSAHTSLGTSLLALGKERQAEAEFKKSLTLGPDYVAFTNLGAVYYNQKRFAEAATVWKQALTINDKDYRLWNNLAIAYEWLGQPDKAKQAFSQELERLEQLAPLSPDDAEIHANLGTMYSQQRLRDKTKTQLDAALALSPEDPAILGKAGESYENLGERSLALDYFRKALQKGGTMDDLEMNPDLRPLLSDPSARRVLEKSMPKAQRATAATR
jgi:serine/threonine protein kinase/Flp pilus assembly protein TadD